MERGGSSDRGFFSYSPYNYVGNNPIRRIDPNGEDWRDIIRGAAVAIADNITHGGVNNRKHTAYNSASDYNLGQDIGDIASALIGTALTIEGGKNIVAGTTVAVGSGGTATIVGGAVAAVGAGEVAVGVGTIKNAVVNFASQKGRVTEEKRQNLEKAAEKEIPNSQLGPSGKPKVHTVSKPNNKQAKDAARNNPKSNSTPEKHSSDKGQKTHYHSTRNGQKQDGKDNIHYEDRSTKRNPD